MADLMTMDLKKLSYDQLHGVIGAVTDVMRDRGLLCKKCDWPICWGIPFCAEKHGNIAPMISMSDLKRLARERQVVRINQS